MLHVHYTWKVPEKGLKTSKVMAKKGCKINVLNILIYALYSIKYGIVFTLYLKKVFENWTKF